MSIKILCNDTIKVDQLCLMEGDSIQIILNRKSTYSIVVTLRVLANDQCELIWNDGKKTVIEKWEDKKGGEDNGE